MSPYGVIRPQWVKLKLFHEVRLPVIVMTVTSTSLIISPIITGVYKYEGYFTNDLEIYDPDFDLPSCEKIEQIIILFTPRKLSWYVQNWKRTGLLKSKSEQSIFDITVT